MATDGSILIADYGDGEAAPQPREAASPSQLTWLRCEGAPLPYGVVWIETDQAFNFAVHSEYAESVTLLFYSATDLINPAFTFRFDFLRNKKGPVWHCRIPVTDIRDARYYAYSVSGPVGDSLQTFDPQKILLDPYARSVFFPPAFDRTLATREGSNAGRAPLGMLAVHRDSFDWEDDLLRHHESDAIIYELHVKDLPGIRTRALIRSLPALMRE